MTFESGKTLGGRITLQEAKTTIGLAAGGIGVAGILTRPSIGFRAANIGSQLLASHIAVAAAWPAIYPSRKLGIQYGGTGEVTTLAKAIPQTGFYGYAPRYIPMLDFGFQITNVPVGSSRLVYEHEKSRGAKDSPSLRTGIAGLRGNGRKTPRKTMRGPSATRKRSTRTRTSSRRRRAKKYCWRHRRYHNCVYTKQL